MKNELVKRTDIKRQSRSTAAFLPASSGLSGSEFVSDADRLDGYHASLAGLPHTIPVLNEYGYLPVTTIPEVAADAPTGHRGRQYIGPTAYLTTPLSASDTTIDVSNNQWTGDERVILSHWTVQEYEEIRLVGGASAVGPNKWRYTITRGAQPVEYPSGSTAVSLGNPDVGGYIVLNSAGGVNTPRMAVYKNDSTVEGGSLWRGAFGKLSGLPTSFTDLFPTKDFTNAWGVATIDGYFSGSIHAYDGSLVNLSILGTLTVQKTNSPAWMEIGATAAGYGWVLRDNSGPAIMALAPYEDDNGIISPIAFIITHNNTRGLYYYIDPVDNTGKLEISANTLVTGHLRSGNRILIGPGEWGADFYGVAIDADVGLLGLAAGDTKQSDANGTYQIWFDIETGKLKLAQGDVTFDGTGHKIALHDDDNLTRRLIRWIHVPTATQAAAFGATGANASYWYTTYGQDADGASITMLPGTGTGIHLKARVEGDSITYQSSASGSHRFLIGDREALILGGASGYVGLSVPFSINGPVTTYWNGAGWIGVGVDDPQALLHVNGITKQMRLSSSALAYADFLVANDLSVTTTGNIVLGPTTKYVMPAKTYDVMLGSAQLKFLSIDVAEIHAETLVARETMTVFGGRALVGPSTSALAYDVQEGDGVIYVKHSGFVLNDIVYLEAYRDGVSQVEFMRINSAYTAAAGGYYRYNVVRNIDSSGLNKWLAGDAVFSTGNVDSGFIDIYAARGVKANTETGPTIVGNVRIDTTYNGWAPRWAVGNLKGLYGYATTTWGSAFGDPTKTWVATDSSNGFRIMYGANVLAQWDTAGVITIYAAGTTGAGLRLTSTAMGYFNGAAYTTYFDGSGNFFIKSGGTGPGDYIGLSTSDTLYRLWIGNDVPANAVFSVTKGGYVKANSGQLGGITLSSNSLYTGSGGTSTGMGAPGNAYAFWAGGAKFTVTHAGVLVAQEANITGTITATAGKIAGFTIDGNILRSTDSNFKLDPVDKRIYFGTTHLRFLDSGGGTIIASNNFTALGDGSFSGSLFSTDFQVGASGSGNFSHNGNTLSFFNTQLYATKRSGWNPTNETTVRSWDCNATTLEQLADVVATLVNDIGSYGLIGVT